MTKIGFDLDTLGVPALNGSGGDMCGPMTAYAIPSMMGRKFIGETAQKVVRLADIFRIPKPIDGHAAKNVDAGECQVRRADWVKPKRV